MDFIDVIKALGEKASRMKDSIQTEEATKTAFVMPFIAALGYDVFNPHEVIPEFVADLGIKKGEKVDIIDPVTGEAVDSYSQTTFVLTVQSDPHFPHVHHTFYLKNRYPWEYQNESLMLVCHKCHQKIHGEETIMVYDDERFKSYSELTPCSRCNGTGYLYEFNYYKNGVCFGCNGACFEEWI